MHTSNFTVPPPFFHISIIYARYLAHNLGLASEMMINITLVDDFVTFNILNAKTTFTCQSNYNLTIETHIPK